MTQEEKSTEGVDTVEIENVTNEPEKGLSLREALEVAVAVNSEEESKEEPKQETPAPQEQEKEKEEKPPELKAPAEFTNEEKEDFAASSRKQQEASLRLYKSSRKRFEEIKQATQEYKEIKSLADSTAPFLKVMGVKEKNEVAIQKALALWHGFEYAENPKFAAAQYLMAKGIDPPKEWLDGEKGNNFLYGNAADDSKIKPLQEKLNLLENRLAQEDKVKVESVLNQTWQSFEATKNASGTSRYPDLQGQAGIEKAARIGSLVSGLTDLSKQFIASARDRIPDLTYMKLLEEAYRFNGGRIDDTAATKTQSAQNHLLKAKRAASSVPGGASSVGVNGAKKKFLTYREAAAAALADLNSE